MLTVSPIAKASVSADAVLDRVRHVVVPDFWFIDMLSSRLGTGPDSLVYELLLGPVGDHESSVSRSSPQPGTLRFAGKRPYFSKVVYCTQSAAVARPPTSPRIDHSSMSTISRSLDEGWDGLGELNLRQWREPSKDRSKNLAAPSRDLLELLVAPR